ncbi:MAG: GNAT family N-acetyltransferase [Chloroflexi bacterium]|nr:GNAT family N-acetyltransferase [Chloroflexota bacterium]
MFEIRPLTQINLDDLTRIASGYTADSKYVVHYHDSVTHTAFELVLTKLDQPYVKAYDHFDAATAQRYGEILASGYSFGAFDGEQLVGLLIAEPQSWNNSVVVCEFHVAETHRRRGIGRRLMEGVAAQATQTGLRIIVCETQTTNTPAIQAYRKLGFRLEGVDISYYTNNDYPDGEVAVFMKRRLDNLENSA